VKQGRTYRPLDHPERRPIGLRRNAYGDACADKMDSRVEHRRLDGRAQLYAQTFVTQTLHDFIGEAAIPAR
jgi:hypothetical protein